LGSILFFLLISNESVEVSIRYSSKSSQAQHCYVFY
jgi:hypothetical protein